MAVMRVPRPLVYRLVTGLPECALFENETQRAEAIRRAAERVDTDWCAPAVFLPALGMCALGVYLGSHLLPPTPPQWLERNAWIWAAVLGLALSGATTLLTFRLARRRVARFLREQLIAAGVPVCLHCGYDLRGQTEPRCSECGKPFDEALLTGVDGQDSPVDSSRSK